MRMAHDFDAPRGIDLLDDNERETIEAIREQARHSTRTVPDDAALADALADTFLLAGADLGDAALAVSVVPQQSYEFRCGRCFLVLHRSLRTGPAHDLCRDCA
jgi:hypothetical protein